MFSKANPSQVEASFSSIIQDRDIYNQIQRYKDKLQNGKTSTEALIEELELNNQWMYHKKADEFGHISHLFVVHRRSLELWKRYPEIIIMDNTYKTNKYSSLA